MDGDVASLRAVLGSDVTTERLKQLLEAANGNPSRAIEIYFHQQDDSSAAAKQTKEQKSAEQGRNWMIIPHKEESKKRPRPSDTSSSPSKTKQSRLDSFFSSPKKMEVLKERKGTVTSSSRTTFSGETNTASDSAKEEQDHRMENAKKPSRNEAKGELTTDTINVDNESDLFFVSFEDFAQVLQTMADTTKRNDKLAALESFIRSIWDRDCGSKNDISSNVDDCGGNSNKYTHDKAQSLTSALELVLGGRTVKPVGVSGSAVSKALAITEGLSRNQLSKAYRQYGDLGDVAASLFQKRNAFFAAKDSSKRPTRLSVLDVSQGLVRISETDGSNAKIAIVQGLLRKCESRIEIRMLVRLLIANMRIGANLKTVLAAIGMVVHKCSLSTNTSIKDFCKLSPDLPSSKDVITIIQKTHDICPNLHRIILSLLEGGLEKMKKECTIEVLVPIAPMLAHPIHDIEDIVDAMFVQEENSKGMIMEWKYVSMMIEH
jgi:DNA ligase N terminus